MEFIPKEIEEYVENLTTEETEVLKKLNRETQAKVLHPRMLSGHIQGRLLSMFSKMIRPTYILEIGTYTGYAAICMAEGLAEGGELHTIDINEELEDMVRGFFEKSGLSAKIEYKLGNALDIIPRLEGSFDLVYIDADKENYINYYDLVVDRMSQGGVILADNVLWSGKVLDGGKGKPSKDTVAIVDFNSLVQRDPRVENVLFPIRDGIMMARKL